MSLLENKNIRLRALEPEDLATLYKWENDTYVWGVSNTLTPFSKHILRLFIENQTQDIYATKQTRFVIEKKGGDTPVGTLDLFDFDPRNRRAGVGILIADGNDRGKGYASEALEAAISYSFKALKLHQLYANICETNDSSLALFRKAGFTECGRRKEWLLTDDGWRDEIELQLINKI